jgi:hypothetical protein
MDKYNRRHSSRQRKEATIQILFASDDPKVRRDSEDLIPVKMCNQSDEGLYIEIDRALMPGSNVRINMVSPEEYHPEEAHYMRDGRVIRCEQIDEAASRFGVGIKILRKVIQTRVLTSRFK